MKTLRRCQCGGKPAIVEVPGPKPIRPRMQRMRDNVHERAECPFCGNATGVHSKRAKLRREWNTAGWCGQAEVREPEPRAAGLAELAGITIRNTYLLDDLTADVALLMPKVPLVSPGMPNRFHPHVLVSAVDTNAFCLEQRVLVHCPGEQHEPTEAEVEQMIRDLDQAFARAAIQPRVFSLEGGAQ